MRHAISAALLTFGLTAALAAPAHAGPTLNLIQNGDFETGTLSPWTASGNLAIANVPYFGGGSTATDGRNMVAFNGGNQPSNGVLAQTFATVAGVQYTVSYSYGTNNGTQQSITASVADNLSTTLTSQFTTSVAGSRSLSPSSFVFTADTASSTLSFTYFSGNPTVNTDGLLDNVSVTAVLETAVPTRIGSVAHLWLGLLGAARRRCAMV